MAGQAPPYSSREAKHEWAVGIYHGDEVDEELCLSCGLRILKAEKFMMSPISFPGENSIEKVLRVIGLGFLLMNQMVIADKRRNPSICLQSFCNPFLISI